MREIIQIQVGQGGIGIGNRFWETISEEHCINKSDGRFNNSSGCGDNNKQQLLEKINVYYNENKFGRYIPRSILIDLEPGTIDNVKSNGGGEFYKVDNFISGKYGAGNNFGKGHYEEGQEVIDSIIDIIRKESEQTDCMQGFQFTHSIGGGTGSGLGTLIINKLREEYPDKMMCTFTITPSPKVSDTVVEPYNAILALHHLLESSDQVMVFDNEALMDICRSSDYGLQSKKDIKYSDLNQIVSIAMSGITCSFRFPNQLNSDLRKLSMNLVPFPRMHFFYVSQAPLFSSFNSGSNNYYYYSIAQLSQQMFDVNNVMAASNPSNGKYFTATAIFRGDIYAKEVDDEMMFQSNVNSNQFVEWIPNNIKSTICNIAPKLKSKSIPNSVTLISNNTCIKDVFQRILSQFSLMFKRKAFIYGFCSGTLEEMELTEAEYNINDLIQEYQLYTEIDNNNDNDNNINYDDDACDNF